MSDSKRFPYIARTQSALPTDLMPFLPLTLERENKSVEVLGLVDSGATVNVLPYQIGLEFGANWEDQPPLFQLDGNLANYESRGLLLIGKVANFMPVSLAFAWTKAENMPVILGQINFLLEFNVCFFRSNQFFEINPK